MDITNCTCYRHDRADGRRCGGVVCYISTRWQCTRLHLLETSDLESIWLLLRRPVMPRQVSHIIIGAIYHPPGAPSGPMAHRIIMAVDTIISQHPHAGVVIVGDFNTLDDRSIRSYPLKQIVRVPARGKATLDKIYTNIENWYKVPYTIYTNYCITTLLNYFLPIQVVERRESDKPWVNDKFRRLIRCRQHA